MPRTFGALQKSVSIEISSGLIDIHTRALTDTAFHIRLLVVRASNVQDALSYI